MSPITGFPGGLPGYNKRATTLPLGWSCRELPGLLSTKALKAPREKERKSEMGSFAFFVFIFSSGFMFRKWALLGCGQ